MMKTMMLLALTLVSQPAAFALQMTCKSYNTFTGNDYEAPNSHLLILGWNEFSCRSVHGHDYLVFVGGIGPGIRTDAGNILSLTCPLISEKRLQKRIKQGKSLTLIGADFAAAVGIGARAGAFVNQRGGLCVLAGGSMALGASAEISAIDIAEDPQYQIQQQRMPGEVFGPFLEKLFTGRSGQ